MKGYIMNTHQYVLNESFKALLDSIFSDKEAATKLKKAFEEVVNDRATTQKINLDRLKAEALEEIGNELATKDFVRAEIAEAKQELKLEIAKVEKEIAEVRTEIAGVKSDYRSLRQEMKFYAIGLGVLIIILQPKVFDFITTFLK
ncbi:hypothetical protein LS72_009900 [Helicobacter apodemus]|uniref:DUF1640 domain-containing protein n=1 Tax=Helicobacter apodemus TaxID=135569 RepID=A0A4U8UDT6_9HELI|nr:hypothetical protein [Helicobacter apodemus]TLE13541.1 hypothetical protein LS72_009900 [Helicobacter apodemus]